MGIYCGGGVAWVLLVLYSGHLGRPAGWVLCWLLPLLFGIRCSALSFLCLFGDGQGVYLPSGQGNRGAITEG